MEMIKCLRCGKEIQKMGNRKYCLSCRMAVDREINSATRRKQRELQKLGSLDSSGEE